MSNLATDEQPDLMTADTSYWATQKNALASLENKTFYKTLIEEGYFKDYVFSLVMSLIDPGVVREGGRAGVIEKLVGVAGLQSHFDLIQAMSSTEEMYEREHDKRAAEQMTKVAKMTAALDIANQDSDFKKVIATGYCEEHSNRQVSLITNDQIIRLGHRTEVLESLAGISVLTNFLVDLDKSRMVVDDDEMED
jgi:hypothetical protein